MILEFHLPIERKKKKTLLTETVLLKQFDLPKLIISFTIPVILKLYQDYNNKPSLP
jgi:hypothetical protein